MSSGNDSYWLSLLQEVGSSSNQLSPNSGNSPHRLHLDPSEYFPTENSDEDRSDERKNELQEENEQPLQQQPQQHVQGQEDGIPPSDGFLNVNIGPYGIFFTGESDGNCHLEEEVNKMEGHSSRRRGVEGVEYGYDVWGGVDVWPDDTTTQQTSNVKYKFTLLENDEEEDNEGKDKPSDGDENGGNSHESFPSSTMPTQTPVTKVTSSGHQSQTVTKISKSHKRRPLTHTLAAVSVKTISRAADRLFRAAHSQTYSILKLGEELTLKFSQTLLSHPTVSAATETVGGCMNESLLFMADRLNYINDRYVAASVMADDPETIHRNRLKEGGLGEVVTWDVRRVIMASLSWQQRQLVAETRDLDTLLLLEDENSATNNTYGKEEEVSDPKYVAALHTPSSAHLSTDPAIKRWLARKATAGDEDAQYTLSRWFSPPAFKENKCCYVCLRLFSVSLFRHHCRHCGESVCTSHSLLRRRIYRFSFVTPVRVCDGCAYKLDAETAVEGLQWRHMRTEAYLRRCLIPYRNPGVDRGVDKAMRIVDASLNVVKNSVILNYPTKIILETIDILKRYGMSGLAGVLLRRDFVEAVETLKRISGLDKMFSPSLHELTACIYYKLAIDRGLRGCNPELELEEHFGVGREECKGNAQRGDKADGSQPRGIGGKDSCTGDKEGEQVCELSDSELDDIIRLAPLALSASYQTDPVECQRIAYTQGWTLLYTETNSQPEQPAYSVFCSQGRNGKASKEVCLTVRGTSSVHDVVTDIRAVPQEFPPSINHIRCALLGLPLPDANAESPTPSVTDESEVECLQGGGEGEVGGGISDEGGRKVKNSNNHIDKEKEKENEKAWEWFKVSSDLEYACGGMARAALWVLSQIGPTLVRLYQEGYQVIMSGHSLGGAVAAMVTHLFNKGMENNRASRCITYGSPSCVCASLCETMKAYVTNVVLHDDIISRIAPHTIRLLMKELFTFRQQVFRHLQQDWADVISRAGSLWSPRWRETHSHSHSNVNANVAITRNHDRVSHGTDTADNECVNGARDPQWASRNNNANQLAGETLQRQRKQDKDTDIGTVAEKNNSNNEGYDDEMEEDVEDSEVVFVGEDAVVELWLPGRVVHIYAHRGQYLACVVPPSFPSLRRIQVQGNVFSDHTCKSLFDALLEVRAVRGCFPLQPPAWSPYDSSEACACCHNSFTWHSTFRGQAEEYRERYNCRNCGALVCGKCSDEKRTIPRYGLIFPTRICDTCLFEGSYAVSRSRGWRDGSKEE